MYERVSEPCALVFLSILNNAPVCPLASMIAAITKPIEPAREQRRSTLAALAAETATFPVQLSSAQQEVAKAEAESPGDLPAKREALERLRAEHAAKEESLQVIMVD